MSSSSEHLQSSPTTRKTNPKPVWLTDELSQEWIDHSPQQQHSQDTKQSSLRVPSNSRIPIPNRYSSTSSLNSLLHQHQSTSISSLNLLQPSSIVPRIPSFNSISQILHSSPSSKHSDPSIILNNNETSNNQTPPWIKAAVGGMVNDVLGKRPTQLEKIFQDSQPSQQHQQHQEPQTEQDQQHPIYHNKSKSPPNPTSDLPHPDHNDCYLGSSNHAYNSHDSIGRAPGSSIHPSSANQSESFLPNVQFQFSVPRYHPPLIIFDDPPSIQPDSPAQSIIEHPGEDEEERESHDQLPIPTPVGCNMERLRFIRDNRLDEIAEVTEPSSSMRTGPKGNQSRSSSPNFGSLPSSFNPPSLPFAHCTPIFDPNRRIPQFNAGVQSSTQFKFHPPQSDPPDTCGLPENQSDIPSCDKPDLSTSQTRFRFTYDTFTRKHLHRLTQEIHGLSISSASALRNHAPLKIKSILGSPGEEVTDSSTSIGLAHSTPPVIMCSTFMRQPRTFHAGRTPFRLVTSLSQRLDEEKQWTGSFVEPSSYAIDSISPVVERKSYMGPQHSQGEFDTLQDTNHPDIQTGPHSCRSSKRIRLEASQANCEIRHRQLRDSVSLSNERNQRRRPPTLPRVHPMVVFKENSCVATTCNTPQEKPPGSSQTVVRDRLAEAKALMDRIRAKNMAGQETDSTPPPDSHKIRRQTPCEHISHKQKPFVSSSTAQTESLSVADQQDERIKERGDQAALRYNQINGYVQRNPESELEWDISIEEGAEDDRDKDEREEEDQRKDELLPRDDKAPNDSNQLATNNALDSVPRRLASTASAFLRQSLGDVNDQYQNGHEKLAQKSGSCSNSTSTNLASTMASRRQFSTQPIFRQPIGRVTHDICNQFTRSNSTIACTTVSAPTPALTIATSTRQSSASLQSQRQESDNYGKQLHVQKLGLMTISPCDVEELLQNRRVGNMIFDSTIGKWVKVRSHSETGGTTGRTAEDEHLNLESLGEAGTQDEVSSDEDDIFKDIESLNSKRASDSSGSALLAGLNCNPSPNLQEESRKGESIGEGRTKLANHSQVSRVDAEEMDDDDRQSTNTKKKTSIIKREKFKPKSVLKAAIESPDNKTAVNAPGSNEKGQSVMGGLKPSRSVSFQDGRKNGKIIGLNNAEEENNEAFVKEQRRSIKESNINDETHSRKGKKAMVTSEEKENKQNTCYHSNHHDQNPVISSENSFNHHEGNHSLNQTSLILINSAKKKVRRKSSSSNTTGTTNSNNNSMIATSPQAHSSSSNVHHHLSPMNSNSNHFIHDSTSNHNMISEYSFELNYSKLIKIITDFEPFEPFWNSIKIINLSNRSIDSVIRLNEILPFLDQIDLSSNQLNYLTGLPSSLRMLIVAKNQISEMCSFNHLKDLVRLDLSHNSLTTLQQLSCLKHLRELKADDNLITDFLGIDQLDSLVKLSLKGNRIKKINFESTNWTHLEVVNLDRNLICELTGLHLLKSVYLLNLDRNQIYLLTIEDLMPNLRVLRINENRLESLDVSKLINLRTLYIDNNDLMDISGASQLRKLENLSVRDQRGGELSLPLKQVRDVKRIYLGGNPLPAAFPTCQFYNLTYLELAMCQCQSLPADLSNLIPNVRTLNLNYNFLKDLSPLKNLKRLERLTVVGSRIKALDSNLLNILASLPELELLDLRQNPLCTSFYPPLLLKSTPSASIAGNKTGSTPHLNQYQIVVKEQEDDWQSIDDRFRKSLPNEFYLKRMTYRSIILKTCGQHSKKLKCLDGIKINELERKKMEKFLRGLSRKLDQKNQSSSSSILDTPDDDKTKDGGHAHWQTKKLATSRSANLDPLQQSAQTNRNLISSGSNSRIADSKHPSSDTHHVGLIDRSRY